MLLFLNFVTFILIAKDQFFQLLAIIIGFEKTMHTVNESTGMLEVYVSIFNPPVGEQLYASIDLVIQTVSVNTSEYMYACVNG